MDKNIKLTPVREKVLEILNQNDHPKGAYEILDQLKTFKSNAVPMTVYRALDYLEEKGLIHKIENLNAYMSCNHPEHNHMCQIIICRECKKVLENCDKEIDYLIKQKTQNQGFQIQSAILEITAICNDCMASA